MATNISSLIIDQIQKTSSQSLLNNISTTLLALTNQTNPINNETSFKIGGGDDDDGLTEETEHHHHHNHQHQHQNQTAALFTEPVSQTKLLASLVLFFITLLCGYLPVRCILNQTYIQYAMFAGGGVLMATAFCHLIPEAHDNYKLARGLTTSPHSHGHLHNHLHNHDHQQINNDTYLGNLTLGSNNNNSLPSITQTLNGTDPSIDYSGSGLSATLSELNIPYLEITLCCGFFFMYLVEQLMIRFINNHTHNHPCDTSLGQLVGSEHSTSNQVIITGMTGSNGNLVSSTNNINFSASSTTTSSQGHNGTEFYKFLRGLLIVSAFGAHSIFDGVAIGSQETIEKVWTIFLAISCHKLIIAAVVGLELYAATLESNLWTLVHLSIFSIMSPIGIILVVLAQNSLQLDSNHPAMILLQSFATGTLLYIVFVEILQPKESHAYEKKRIGKSFSLIAGFALMLIVLTVIGEG